MLLFSLDTHTHYLLCRLSPAVRMKSKLFWILCKMFWGLDSAVAPASGSLHTWQVLYFLVTAKHMVPAARNSFPVLYSYWFSPPHSSGSDDSHPFHLPHQAKLCPCDHNGHRLETARLFLLTTLHAGASPVSHVSVCTHACILCMCTYVHTPIIWTCT